MQQTKTHTSRILHLKLLVLIRKKNTVRVGNWRIFSWNLFGHQFPPVDLADLKTTEGVEPLKLQTHWLGGG